MNPQIDDLISKLARPCTVPYEQTRRAIVALSEIGQPAIDPLLAALRDGEHYPHEIVEAIVAIGNTPIANEIIQALEKENNAAWRGSTLKCLEASRDTWTIAPLIWGLKDSEKETRLLSVWLLLSLDGRNPESHQKVKEALDDFGRLQYGDIGYDDLHTLTHLASVDPVVRKSAMQKWALGVASHLTLLNDIWALYDCFSHLKYWRDDDAYRRYPQLALDAIAETIGMCGDSGIESLIDALSSSSANKTKAAIQGLIKAGPVALNRLHGLLKQEPERNTAAVIQVLGGIGSKSSIEPLQGLLRQYNSLYIGLYAARALRKIGDKNESAQATIAEVLGRFAGNPTAAVEYRDVRLLGYLHLTHVAPFDDPETQDEQLQRAAVEAWVGVEDPNTRLLCDVLNGFRHVQQAIVEVLIRLEVPGVEALYGHKDATSLDASDMNLLIGALQKWDDEIRETAISAILRIGEETVEPLYELLTDDSDVGWDANIEHMPQMFVAADVLARIGGRLATDALVRAVIRGGGGWGERVRQAASEALEKIGEPALAPLLHVAKYGKPRDAEVVGFVLETLLETNSIVEALAKSNKSEAMDALFDFLGNQEAHDRVIRDRQPVAICSTEATLRALNVTKESSTSLQLFEFLETKRTDLLCTIMSALEAIKDDRALEPLRLLTKSRREKVRDAATKALKALGAGDQELLLP